jgi:hypothetical protein
MSAHSRKGCNLAFALALWIGSGATSFADSPLPPPQDIEVRSPDGRCVARADVAASRIVVSRVIDGRLERCGRSQNIEGFSRSRMTAGPLSSSIREQICST